jgi:hypothetical protein
VGQSDWKARHQYVSARSSSEGGERFQLADALYQAVRQDRVICGDCGRQDESVVHFYRRESFFTFPDQPMTLFRPMADVEALFKRGGVRGGFGWRRT